MFMFDSVSVSQIPLDAKAVAGYVGGEWITFPVLKKKFPHAWKLSIAVNAFENAECLDVEKGDASPSQAPLWVKKQRSRGVKRPVIYVQISNVNAVLNELAKSGIKRKQVRLWTAHYTYHPHICNKKCGFGFTGKADATQFTNRALGRDLDESSLVSNFFGHWAWVWVKTLVWKKLNKPL